LSILQSVGLGTALLINLFKRSKGGTYNILIRVYEYVIPISNLNHL